MESKDKSSGVIAVAVAATGFSWGFILLKAIALPPLVLAFYRVLLGASILTVAAWVLGVGWPSTRKAMFGAGIAFGVHHLCAIAAVKMTSVVIVALVMAAKPLLVSLISRRAVGERVEPALAGYALVAVVGVAIVVHANVDDRSHHWLGDVFAVGYLAGFTSFFLFNKRARLDDAPALTLTAGSLWVSLLIVGPGMIWAVTRGDGPYAPTSDDAMLLLILVLGPANGHLLVNWAHARVSAALGSIILALVPILASAWAYLVLDEPYTWRQLVGMILVVIAIEGGRRVESKRTAGPATDPGSRP